MSMDDRPTSPQEVFSKRAAFYATSKVHDDKETLSWLVELAAPGREDVALDVGTGAGHTAMAIAPLVHRVDAVDLTEEMMDQARKLCHHRGITNISFHVADAMSLPFPDASYDIVTCRRAAHHFTDVRKALAEMVRVLRPGGRLVIDDRSVPEDDEVDRLINRLDVLHDPSHVRDYRESEWRALITGAGLELASLRPYRKRVPLSHFTDMVEPPTAAAMTDLVRSASERVRKEVGIEVLDGKVVMDNFFVLIAALKRSPESTQRTEP
jgi:ubiquinone/menaquinone biosynthesis C-methylase UbiE